MPNQTTSPILPESRWAKLDEEEVEACANYELWRDQCLQGGRTVPPAWMDLNNRDQAQARKKCWVARFGPDLPAVFEPGPWFGSKPELENGEEHHSVEIVELGVRWDRSDHDLAVSFQAWLARQRRTNPNAKFFAGKKGGNRSSAWSFLLRLAMLRANDANIDKEVVRRELRGLAQKADGKDRLLPKYFMEEVHEAERIIRQGKPGRSRSNRQPKSAGYHQRNR